MAGTSENQFLAGQLSGWLSGWMAGWLADRKRVSWLLVLILARALLGYRSCWSQTNLHKHIYAYFQTVKSLCFGFCAHLCIFFYKFVHIFAHICAHFVQICAHFVKPWCRFDS